MRTITTREPKWHHLKTWPPYFQMILDGSKTFDLRENDRDFQEGDYLVLEEYLPDEERYTDRVTIRRVGVVVYEQWGLGKNVCAMSLINDGYKAGGLIEIRRGLYCTKCESLDQFYEQGRCCDCGQPWETEVIHEKDWPDYWKSVTIAVIERSSK